MRTIVAVGAHHDDVELRCGGTLAKYVQDGERVIYALATTTPHYNPFDDEIASGTYRSNAEIISLRKEEAEKGAKTLGISEIHFFDFKSLYWYKEGTLERRYFDGYKTTAEEFNYLIEELPGREFIISAHRCAHAVSFLSEFLRSCKADTVLTHFTDDGHWEHYATSLFVFQAVRDLSEEGIAIDLFAWECGGAGSLFSSFAPTHFVDISATIDIKCESLKSFTSQFADHNTEPFSKRARRRAAEWGKVAGMEHAEPFMKFDSTFRSGEDIILSRTYNASEAVKELYQKEISSQQ